MLPPISNVAKASEIAVWKKKLAVSNCFRKLFEKIEDDENDTYMTKIIKNVWPKKKNIPNLQIAWAISISEIFLNPKNKVIKMSEEIIQPALARNLKKIENEEGFEYESDSSPTSQRPVSPERQKDPEKQIEPERNKRKKRSIEVETLRKNLKKSKRKVEGKKNDEYEGDEGEESEEGDEGEDDDDEDDEDEEGEDEEYHNKILKMRLRLTRRDMPATYRLFETLRKNLKKSKRKVEGKKNDEYEGDEGEESEEGDEGEDDDDEDDEDEEGEDEEYHNKIVNIESED
ncbi:hypothetical protein Glove_28g11 [Diversispora epigaea]|uniref:Uncharacterized protein n=1 Tax=Diversispora epigaea TaxID=1348612 RepID=A0A397JKU4_9GLOM|nr:hypothetical protein Glove_28g11 [Diversispora epigaea]